MPKVLTGSSRASFNFVFSHWRGLLKITLLPFVAVAAVAFLDGWLMLGFFEKIAALGPGIHNDPTLFRPVMSTVFSMDALALLIGVGFCWLFVRVVRFWKSPEAASYGLSSGEAGATGMTFLYGLGIGALTMLVYVACIIVFVILAIIAALIMSKTVLAVLGPLIGFIVIVAAFFGLVTFACRFLVGLPAVALGETPDFFARLWPLAKGESFGLPLRMVFWSLVITIPLGAITFLIMWPTWSDIFHNMQTGANPPSSPETMVEILKSMFPLQAFGLVLEVPLIWFFASLFSEAYTRFNARVH